MPHFLLVFFVLTQKFRMGVLWVLYLCYLSLISFYPYQLQLYLPTFSLSIAKIWKTTQHFQKYNNIFIHKRSVVFKFIISRGENVGNADINCTYLSSHLPRMPFSFCKESLLLSLLSHRTC